ncbi:MAG: DNA polymerase II large subunit [Euryarchaeota archaeon]|nr:DNA polymerase II large subunit [Euryarchaeota archaeon]
MLSYFRSLEKGLDAAYSVAGKARAKGLDPELFVEVRRTSDMAERVEYLLEIEGIAEDIRELAQQMGREELSIEIAKRIAKRSKGHLDRALEKAVRAGLAILTEGILVAPIEGIAKAAVGKNADGSSYASVFFAGPIRSAGGTGQAMSVLLADVVRRELGIGKYIPTNEEIERWKEEIPLYKQCQHLQYIPSNREIEMIVSGCPVCVDGEGTEDAEVAGYRNLPRVQDNRVRGGACLIIAEGLSQKAAKIQAHVKRLGIDGWSFIDDLLSLKRGSAEKWSGIKPQDKYLHDLIAGRPVLSYPSRKGGFRLRYGKSRTNGLAGLAVHPSLMKLLNGAIAIGTQIKIERPGKAGVVTPCDTIEPPIVLTERGDLVEADEYMRAGGPTDGARVVDLGEILIPIGEFLENNHPLVPAAYSIERYGAELCAKGFAPDGPLDAMGFDESLSVSRKYGVPLHPMYNLFWHDVRADDMAALSDFILANGRLSEGRLVLPRDEGMKKILVSLGALHRIDGDSVSLDRYALSLIHCLGLKAEGGKISRAVEMPPGVTDSMKLVNALAGMRVMPRGKTRIGARMARPEKASERKMKPPVHVLFPIAGSGGPQRLVNESAKRGRPVRAEVENRYCRKCYLHTFSHSCAQCGAHTESLRRMMDDTLQVNAIFDAARKRVGADPAVKVKGVKGLSSRNKSVEPLEKGMVRARHGVFIYKDGTSRFDLTDAPLTHFKPREIGITAAKARELGYALDICGRPLTSDDQMLELRPQDLIISKAGGEYLVRTTQFVDDLLSSFYKLEPYYEMSEPSELIGTLLLGLSPHTSVGVLCRLIGYTDAAVCYAHPYYHAAKRRNCDGDEDCVMLLMDALLNFSKAYLPEKRGGHMDAPLILSPRIDPLEIDKEALNIDAYSSIPLEVYEASDRLESAKSVEKCIDNAKRRVGSLLQYEGFGFTHDTTDISAGETVSAYKTLDDMEEMTEMQMRLAERIDAVDENDVANRVVSQHLLPDMIGNMGAFATQSFRCTACGAKYRRIPLTGKCKCGKDVIMTVHKGNIMKYLSLCKRLAGKYRLSPYTLQRLELIEGAVRMSFSEEDAPSLSRYCAEPPAEPEPDEGHEEEPEELAQGDE